MRVPSRYATELPVAGVRPNSLAVSILQVMTTEIWNHTVIVTKKRMKAFLLPYDEDEFASLVLQHSPSFPKMIEKAVSSKRRIPLTEVQRHHTKKRD